MKLMINSTILYAEENITWLNIIEIPLLSNSSCEQIHGVCVMPLRISFFFSCIIKIVVIHIYVAVLEILYCGWIKIKFKFTAIMIFCLQIMLPKYVVIMINSVLKFLQIII